MIKPYDAHVDRQEPLANANARVSAPETMEIPTFASTGHHLHEEYPNYITTCITSTALQKPHLHELAPRFLRSQEVGIPRTFEKDIGDVIGVFLIIILLFTCIAGLRRLLRRRRQSVEGRGRPLTRRRDMEQGDTMGLHRGALWAASG